MSREVYERVKDRIIAESVGDMLLKGKSEAIEVFSLKGLV
jgi:class 3 adenylate cyclase